MLIEGMIFKNYKELCSHLGWEIKEGNAKKAQMKELDAKCKWYKQGQKIVIEFVYEYEKTKEDGRSKNNVYINPVEVILLFALKGMEKPEIYFSNSKMYRILGLFNDKFEELNYGDTNEIIQELVVDYLTAKSFKITSKAEANRIIKRALKGMKNRRTIDYIEGRIIVGADDTHRVATPEEARILTKIEKECLDEVGCLNFTQLEYKNLFFKYNKLLKEKIEETSIKNFSHSYDGYCVISHNKLIADEIDRQCKDDNFKALNDLFCEKLRATAKSKHKSAKKKLENNTKFGEGIAFGEASEGYTKEFDRLIGRYVRF